MTSQGQKHKVRVLTPQQLINLGGNQLRFIRPSQRSVFSAPVNHSTIRPAHTSPALICPSIGSVSDHSNHSPDLAQHLHIQPSSAQPSPPLSQPSSQSSESETSKATATAQWCDSDGKILVSSVLKKSAGAKKREGGSSGCAPPNFTTLEKYMEEEMHTLKEPLEIPAEEVSHCSSLLHEASDYGVSSGSTGPSFQTPVCTPYRKQPKRIHGSGTRQAAVRNSLQHQCIAYLKKAKERRDLRLENEKRKVQLEEDNLKLRREKLALEEERLKFERQKYEYKKAKEKMKNEQWTRRLQIEEDWLAALKELIVTKAHFNKESTIVLST
ncbi:Meiotically up-regulated gene 137 protein [Frankliniella fusca]|uniref:Meiotically up-regulated gene 137 protein n=1 Tax=Frankliniella fusca TaxID=407009 RepID=A0AAE1LLJ3_9NEOP|nr:Meiotically up-regulated gene 137 protein [Frankliniella fusca]